MSKVTWAGLCVIDAAIDALVVWRVGASVIARAEALGFERT